jgi:hypothetical protein
LTSFRWVNPMGIISLPCEFLNIYNRQWMTEMIFDTCQPLGGHVWCSVVRDLIIERWQTIFSDPSTLRYHLEHFVFWWNEIGRKCSNKILTLLPPLYRLLTGWFSNHSYCLWYIFLLTSSFCEKMFDFNTISVRLLLYS